MVQPAQYLFFPQMRGGANHRLPSADYNVMHQLFVYIFLLVRTSRIAALANFKLAQHCCDD